MTDSLKTSDFDYELPESAIAQHPAEPRDSCRLAVLDRASGAVEHARFSDLGRFLKPGDRLVLNNSKVMASRVLGRKDPGGAAVEALLLAPKPGRRVWEALLKPARRLKPGQFLKVREVEGRPEGFNVIEKTEQGTAWLEWTGPQPLDQEALDQIGLPPLPPYIRRSANLTTDPRLDQDRQAYQTIYARLEGSAAAPTAGLHFTQPLLDKLALQGIGLSQVCLHVGLGTFLAVKEEDLHLHHMHSESFEVDSNSANEINSTIRNKGRIIAVGTTSLRVLESAGTAQSGLKSGAGKTELFIKPGYDFSICRGLLTNFHVPRSTLLMLVCALDQRERILKLYEDCLGRGYKFLSYGDAMLIL